MTHSTKPATGRVRKYIGYAGGPNVLRWCGGPWVRFLGYGKSLLEAKRCDDHTHQVTVTVTSVRLHKDKRGK